MEPLKITFEMVFPIVLGWPWIALDGLLAHFELLRTLGSDYFLLESKKVETEMVNDLYIPLGRWHDIYMSSVSIFEPKKIFEETIYKRFETKGAINIGKRKRQKVHINSGYFRNFMIALPYIPAQKVIFYAFGERERIEEILSYVPGLGKKVAIGFGEIKNIKVESIDKNYSLVKDGLAMRPVPVEYTKDYEEIARLAYTFPYWDKTLVKECVVPFSKVKLDGWENS